MKNMCSNMCTKVCGKWANRNLGLLFIRIALGVTFIMFGWQKLSHMTDTVAFFSMIGMAAFWAYVTAIVEFVGGIVILLGVFIAPATILLAITMFVAVVAVTWKAGFVGGYALNFTLFFSLLGLCMTGAGKYAILRCPWSQGCGKGNGCECGKETCSTCQVPPVQQ